MGPLAIGLIGAAANTGLGMLTGAAQDKRQLRGQMKLQRQQIKGQKEMGKFNQALAIDTWNKTNFAAQRKHMEEAGLNVGLMYEGNAQGGTTSQPGNVTGGVAAPRSDNFAGLGLQMGMQLALQKAQIENIEAQTEKTKTETIKTAGVDTTEAQTRIENLKQSTNNAKVQQAILQYETVLKETESNVANKSAEDRINTIKSAASKLAQEVRSAKIKGDIDENTAQNVITQINNVTQEQNLRIEAAKTGIEKTTQETKNLKQDETQKILENAMRKQGIQPADNALFRKALEVLNEIGAEPAEVGKKAKLIMLWLKGQAGEQTTTHLKELLSEQ